MTSPLRAGERSIRHQVVIPESLDRLLRARAVLEGDLKISEAIRIAIEAWLGATPACKACAHRKRSGLEGQCPACANDRVRAEKAAERDAPTPTAPRT